MSDFVPVNDLDYDIFVKTCVDMFKGTDYCSKCRQRYTLELSSHLIPEGNKCQMELEGFLRVNCPVCGNPLKLQPLIS